MSRFHIGIPNREPLPECRLVLSCSERSRFALQWCQSRSVFLPRDAMLSNRPNLTLDEEAFQNLLSAAFTIQSHNDQIKQARLTEKEPGAGSVCRHCGAPKAAERARCETCGLDEFRPGERLQRSWASLWLMSQEQGLWPERAAEVRENTYKDAPPRAEAKSNSSADGLFSLPFAKEVAEEAAELEAVRAGGKSPLRESLPAPSAPGKSDSDDLAVDKIVAKGELTPADTNDAGSENLASAGSAVYESETADLAPEDSRLTVQPFYLSGSNDSSPADAGPDAATDPSDAASNPLVQRFRDLRVTLRFHRADLYLGAAIFVAGISLLWPVAGSPRRAALGPLDRALVTLGIAEAPAVPVVHLQGDPGILVWVDPHAALYYCPGEEPYGKTTNGRFSSQHEAQMDRFEPASRSACE